LTDGIVKRILISSTHQYGIRVELKDGKIGRVQNTIWLSKPGESETNSGFYQNKKSKHLVLFWQVVII